MKSLKDFITVAEFLGEDISKEHASMLMDKAKQCLSESDLNRLSNHVGGDLYTQIREHDAECGRF